DIDGLNTLILATPQKKIIQSIGRILRKPFRKGDINPLIIDINDELNCFSKWGKRRKQYYNSKKYIIDQMRSINDNCVSVKDYLIHKGLYDINSNNNYEE